MAGHDVYLNVAGGMRVREPAADLAVAAALVSSLTGVPLPSNSVIFGEVSLSGARRAVAHSQARLKEAAKLGFEHAIFAHGGNQAKVPSCGLAARALTNLADLVASIVTAGTLKPEAAQSLLDDFLPSDRPQAEACV